MPQSLEVTDFLTNPGIILDVRSPAEYTQGHIPGAVSFPLFTDEERAQVGICYKHQGRDQAVELGFAIAGPKFADFIARAKELAPDRVVRLHCWRGGMRSGAVAWVLEMAGFHVSTLVGGYKAFRRWVLETTYVPRPILILGGMTGTGKTAILSALADMGEQVLDLEAIAHHRGSSFGSLGMPLQPTNEQFENTVATQWVAFDPQRPVWIEAESKRIGICRIPESLFQQMHRAPVIEVVRSRQERLSLLVDVYGSADVEELVAATERIRKRLGGLRTQQAIELLRQQQLTEAFDIILEYYDKTYTYDLQQRSTPIYPLNLSGLSPSVSATQLIQQARQLVPNLEGTLESHRIFAPLSQVQMASS
ncbi:tRNA 2-selenouridine(34) synthase MnmH [Oscillatoria sp. FACHB-1407]|uniref:tRNA 2-selenouridine(34) synthase MnmH n=1 Tax=Oscillatoria sp. FACHB-1407 TaxID=2692847 RepID=UPI001686A34C|nr:tRNA 2-selenouridine(34) synthase MnmH [Oscillatoria sp. FACHB-1407]MBD2461705.1 tRNA 2-selenouridine(34) synthase MnmH [Oscillatoria sp. FACHB-1407]